MHVGELVEKTAKEKRMSNADIARRLNKVPSAISHMYKRKSLDVELLIELGAILEVDFLEQIRKYHGLESKSYEDNPTTQSQVKEIATSYAQKKALEVPITVTLDGSLDTLNLWINRLTAINSAV